MPVTLACLCDGTSTHYHGVGRLIIDEGAFEGSLYLPHLTADDGRSADGELTFSIPENNGLINDKEALLTLILTDQTTTQWGEWGVRMLIAMPGASHPDGDTNPAPSGLFYSNDNNERGALIGHFGQPCHRNDADHASYGSCGPEN